MFGALTPEKANLAPFIGFLAISALGGAVAHFCDGSAYWVASDPRYWVIPVQTVICGALLAWGWRRYDWRASSAVAPAALMTDAIGLAVGAAAFVIWVAPQQWMGFPPRLDGFNPEFFRASGWPYFLNTGVRFVRLVIIVPLVEEIFWRSFLLRYLIEEDFTRVPFGAFSWKSFGIVTAGFCLEHAMTDWPAALATGLLYNFLAYRTRSLRACVLAHATTNLLLGIYVLHTRQWGFW